MSDLNDMMVFLTVVEQGSFTLAGEELQLPKSNISRKVSRLEKTLGTRLLERSTRSLHLTEVGSIYYQHCLRIKEELDSATLCVQKSAVVVSGSLKVCCSVAVGQELLAYHLAEFKRLFPLLDIHLTLDNRKAERVEEHFDIVISSREEAASGLTTRKLLTVNWHLYAGQNYLAETSVQGLKLDSLSDLTQHACLYMGDVDKAGWKLFNHQQQLTINVKPSISVNDFFVLKTMAEQDLGVVLLPDYFVEPSETSLVRVLPEVIGQQTGLYALYSSRHYLSPKVKVLLDYLDQQLSDGE